MIDHLTILIPLFFATAVIYSMAGFGGGSTYLALLVLFSVPFDSIRSIALCCNIAVVSIGWWHFSSHLRMKRLLPFLLTSIPLAYLGGTITLGKTAFTVVLGGSLCVAAIRMLLAGRAFESRSEIPAKSLWILGLLIGSLLGFVSGLVGIGGGIYLSPMLLFLGWADAKEAAAAASCFILVNSLAGLISQVSHGLSIPFLSIAPLLIAVTLGGFLGSRAGSRSIPKLGLQRVTGVLILWVSIRLLWGLVRV